ncbi:MAG TPA: outer membrane beta-barrel protein [Pyrinomonadaceae bacterium]|jgi:opacity protein-like surface antigen
MKRLLTLAALSLIFAHAALAQSNAIENLLVSDHLPAPADSYKPARATAAAQSDEYKKWEFFGGYSAMQFDTLAGDTSNTAVDEVLGGRNTLRGFNASITRNFTKYFGVKFDYSLHLREDNFSRPAGSGTVDSTVQNFLGGIQVKNNSEDGPWFKPFGHALFGMANQKIDVDSPQLPAVFGVSDLHVNETSFAMAFGGGVDIRLNKRFDVRAVQIDWNIINRGDQQTGIVLVPTPFQTVGSPFIIGGTRQDNLRLSVGIVIH